MASERDARRRAYVDKAATELEGLAARGVRMGGNAFSAVLLAKGELSDAEKLDFIVDTAELCSCRRRIRQIRAALSSSSRPDEESQALFREATELQRRVNELVRTLSSVSSE